MEGHKGDRGVNFRALEELFQLALTSPKEISYTFKVSVLEVYNETVMDLLNSEK